MRLLAKVAGIPAQNLDGYFDSKEAVIRALIDERVAVLCSAILDEAQEAEPGMPRPIAFAREYRAIAHTCRAYYDLFMMKPHPEERRELHKEHESGFDLILTLGEDAQAAIELGQVRPMDPRQVILALWTVAQGYVSLELSGAMDDLDPDPMSRERTYLHWLESMLRGLEMRSSTS